MDGVKRKANGHEQAKKKKKKAQVIDEQDAETVYFESEITYHSTVTKMKVSVTRRGNSRLHSFVLLIKGQRLAQRSDVESRSTRRNRSVRRDDRYRTEIHSSGQSSAGESYAACASFQLRVRL